MTPRLTGPAIAAAVAALTAGPIPAPADPPVDAVLVDGLAVLVGARHSAESEATPILISDVDLFADLLSVIGSDADGAVPPSGASLRARARRAASLVRLLALQARQMGEEVSGEDRSALRGEIASRLGGEEGLDAELVRRGMDPRELDRWLEDLILAAGQVRYLRDRVSAPSDADLAGLFISGGHRAGGAEYDSAREEYRRIVENEQTRQSLSTWLAASVERGGLRIVP